MSPDLVAVAGFIGAIAAGCLIAWLGDRRHHAPSHVPDEIDVDEDHRRWLQGRTF